MKTIIFILTLALLSGCEYHKDASKVDNWRARKRIDLFRECMGLAANMPRQSDDDVSDIVSDCSDAAYYMSNGLQYSEEK